MGNVSFINLKYNTDKTKHATILFDKTYHTKKKIERFMDESHQKSRNLHLNQK